ncbi:MAG TPA: hypothetical protein VK900_02100 [Anaerolineales bacterium]|nr:hypothetical protein [Anaerolineales bacterium]
MPRKRPFGVTLLLWLVLSLSAWGAVRWLAALRWWEVLAEFEPHLSPLYLSITGAAWVVAGGVLLWGLFAGKPWTWLAIPVSMCLWLLEYWIERLFFQSPRPNLSFAILASLLLLTTTLISAFNRKTKSFLIRSEEHEQPNQDPESA